MPNSLIGYLTYLGISLLYMILRYRHKNNENTYQWVSEIMVIVLIPFAGLIIAWILRAARSFHHSEIETYFANVYLSNEVELSTLEKLDVHKEINLIPIEEALILNDFKIRRRMLLDLLKNDFIQQLSTLNIAINNEDTETSHYAAVAIVEVKRKLLLSLQEMSKHYDENKRNIDYLSTYAKTIKQYLHSGFLDQRTDINYKQLYASVLSDLLEVKQNDEMYMIEKVNTEIDLGRYTEAKKYSEAYLHAYPEREQAYLMLLKLHYLQKKYTELTEVLKQLRTSSIPFTNQTRSIIEFWSRGV